jgi:dihydromethanopterin reductase (acceptor)
MGVHVAWVVTGAGHCLEETFDVMDRLVKDNKVKVTSYLSSAGEQVVKMYGFWSKLEQISPGSYLQEILTENKEGPGFSHAGRLVMDLYDVLVVSPASGNTVAKIVCGIADTLTTNAFAQAQKGDVPVYVVPTDQKEGVVETTLPYRVDRRECKLCEPCPVVEMCSYSAFKIVDGVPRIDSVLCQGCGFCVTACPFGAVKVGEKKKLRIRGIDVQNVKKLQLMEGVTVLENPQQIETVIAKLQTKNGCRS